MAARTGVGVGMGVTVAVLALAALGGFVGTFVFMGQKQTAEAARADAQAKVNDIIRANEQSSDSVRLLIDEARKDNSSAIGYVLKRYSELSTAVTGQANETPKSLQSKVNAARGSNNSALVQILADRENKIADLDKELAAAKASAQSAREELENSANRAKAGAEAQEAVIKSLSSELKTYKDNVDKYSGDVQKRVAEMAASIEKVKRESNDEIVRLNDTITRLRQEALLAQGKIESLTAERRKQTLRPGDEAALVDGQIIGQGVNANEVTINRGKNQRVVLGMTFEVYAEPSLIKLDTDGNYARGKASLEVVRVDFNTSVARITRGVRGQPVVPGDVFASALYDPNKVYTFMVFGNFEGADGVATPAAGYDIKALVENWGGKVAESLTGDVDFLILGSRPILPPAPPADAPIAVMQNFLQQRRIVQEYDRLLQQASATQIPVLNQNRLMTLIGK
jgi:hypothetical protein